MRSFLILQSMNYLTVKKERFFAKGLNYLSIYLDCADYLVDFELFYRNIVNLGIFGSSHQWCSIKKVVLRNFRKFTGKHLCESVF